MEKAPTYGELLAEVALLREQNRRKDERIAYLERLLYGVKSDRLASQVPEDQPGLFNGLFEQAMDEKALQVEQMAKEIEKEAAKRRCQAKKSPSRPSQYRYSGLEERLTTLSPRESMRLSNKFGQSLFIV